jgi:hypothetical protein
MTSTPERQTTGVSWKKEPNAHSHHHTLDIYRSPHHPIKQGKLVKDNSLTGLV